MVRMGSPVRFRRGGSTPTAGQAKVMWLFVMKRGEVPLMAP
jgi:hypothetical protein